MKGGKWIVTETDQRASDRAMTAFCPMHAAGQRRQKCNLSKPKRTDSQNGLQKTRESCQKGKLKLNDIFGLIFLIKILKNQTWFSYWNLELKTSLYMYFFK